MKQLPFRILVSSDGIVFEYETRQEQAAIHLAKTYLAGDFEKEIKVKILKESEEEGLVEVKF